MPPARTHNKPPSSTRRAGDDNAQTRPAVSRLHARCDARRPEDARRLIRNVQDLHVPVAPEYKLRTREAEAPRCTRIRS